MTEQHNPAVRCAGLEKTYNGSRGRVSALKDFNLDVGHGEVFGLIGPNGAGKTTLIRILVNILRRTRGLLEVLGTDPEKQPGVTKRLGWVPQDGDRSLYGKLTGLENLLLFARLQGLGKKEAQKKIHQLWDQMGLKEGLLSRPVTGYSGGERQACIMVRAFISGPELVILDEPTKGLDVLVARQMRAFICNWARENGGTVIITGHNLHEVEEICDRVAIICNGRLVREGTVVDLQNSVKSRSRVIIRGLPDGQAAWLKDRLASFGEVETGLYRPGRLQVITDSSLNTLSEIIKLVRAAGPGIELETVHLSLEEIYVQIIGEQGGKGEEVDLAEKNRHCLVGGRAGSQTGCTL